MQYLNKIGIKSKKAFRTLQGVNHKRIKSVLDDYCKNIAENKRKIIKDDAFKDDLGQFSELVFRQLISESGYTEDTYIKGTRQDLAREQMVETIRTSLKLPETITENKQEHNTKNQKKDEGEY